MSGAPAILFDLGGVLIDWNPRYVYRSLFPTEAGMEQFMATVCTSEWNASIDAGKPFAEAIRERQLAVPEFAELIGYWHTRWTDMLGDAIPGTVEVFAELRGRGLKVCALTNWSAETFPIARERFPFLGWFEHIVVSGEVRLAKPDPAIFKLALEVCALTPAGTLFIDDSPMNVETARGLGLDAILFRNAVQLREELVGRGLLPAVAGASKRAGTL